MRLRSLLSISTIALLAAGSQAQAQEADQIITEGANTIIVTGTLRETSLQDADVSVTVIDREALDQARIRNIRQLDGVVPNVQFNESGQLGSTFISIRGIESNPFIVNRAAVYIDGIPFRELSNAVLNQVQSVEVLRGPQATLYGANSESGLIIINTRAPSTDTSGELRLAGVAFGNGLETAADGFLAGPIINDRLTGSIAFKVSDGDSFLKNLHPDLPPGRIREAFVQGRLRWTPNDRLTVNANAYVLDTHAPGVFDQEYLPLDVDLYNASYADLFNGGRRASNFDYINDAPKQTDEVEYVVGTSARYELGYGAIDAAVSYRGLKTNARGLDFDFTMLPTAAGQDFKDRDFWNAEIRFSSPANNPFNYIVGVNHYRQKTKRFQTTFVGPGTLDDFKPAPLQFANARDWGIFASARWSPEFLPQVTVGAGLRYDHAARSAEQKAGQIDLGGGNLFILRDASLSEDFEVFLPRFSISYAPSARLTFYGSAAKGYIPGGFNLAAAQANLADQVLRYDSETMWSYEGGFRWRAPDGLFRVNGAAFYIRANNWQELQVATDNLGRIISTDFIGSDASIDSKGFELEAEINPVAGLTLTGNFGYSDARYRNLQLDANTNVRGERVKLVPAYDGYLAARYQTRSGLFVRGEISMAGKQSLDSRGDAVQPATEMIGLQAGYEGPRWTARLFVENLTDVRRATGLAFRNLVFGNDGNFYAPIGRSRQGGIEIGFNF